MIKGLGPSLERWFRASFGVRTCADLAALFPDPIDGSAKTSDAGSRPGRFGTF